MTKGQLREQASSKYHDFVFGLRSGTPAHEIEPKLRETVPPEDLTAFRDAFYLHCRVVGSERDKYWTVAAALQNQFCLNI